MELTKIRPSDIAWTVLLAAAGVVLMVANITAGPHPDVRVDSHSWALVPVFLLAVAPVLWRRTDAVAATAVSTVAIGLHDVVFGSLIRCGAGLPLSFVLAYSVGRFVHPSRSYLGMGLVVALQAAVLVRDTAAGIAILPATAIIGLVAFGIGALVRTRQERRADAPAATPELSYV